MTTEESLLTNNKIQLLEPFTTTKAHHMMKCLTCEHEWSATPISKKQTFKKNGVSGCPQCKRLRDEQEYVVTRLANLQYLSELGIIPLDGWDGRRSVNNKPISVKVKNIKCGHEFTSTSANLLSRNVLCSVCGKGQRSAQLTQTSLDRSAEWQLTAPEWLVYRAKVDSLTRTAYTQHKSTINPHNHPRGLAGTAGAYQLDHIVPVRYGFENDIPAELIAHYTNLQMLHWRENVSEGANLKEGISIPEVLHKYIVVV